MKMIRWIHGIWLKYHVRSEAIRRRAQVKPIVAHVCKRRLSWYGHIRRIDHEDITALNSARQGCLERHPEAGPASDGCNGQYQERYENIWPRV